MVVITVRILYIMIYGGWEYIDTNNAALEYLGCVSMVDYLYSLGWKHRYTSSLGDVALKMEKDDGEFREIIVHGPECYQGYWPRQVILLSWWIASSIYSKSQ